MFQFMSFPPLGILRTHNGLLSGWLDQLMTMDRALRPVVHRQGRVLFRSSLSFSVVFQSLRLFILSIFYCEDPAHSFSFHTDSINNYKK